MYFFFFTSHFILHIDYLYSYATIACIIFAVYLCKQFLSVTMRNSPRIPSLFKVQIKIYLFSRSALCCFRWSLSKGPTPYPAHKYQRIVTARIQTILRYCVLIVFAPVFSDSSTYTQSYKYEDVCYYLPSFLSSPSGLLFFSPIYFLNSLFCSVFPDGTLLFLCSKSLIYYFFILLLLFNTWMVKMADRDSGEKVKVLCTFFF